MTVPVMMTANRLRDGAVIWLQADLRWSADSAAAARFSGAAYDAAKAQAEDAVPDAIATIIDCYRRLRHDGETFAGCLERCGLDPFKAAFNAYS